MIFCKGSANLLKYKINLDLFFLIGCRLILSSYMKETIIIIRIAWNEQDGYAISGNWVQSARKDRSVMLQHSVTR